MWSRGGIICTGETYRQVVNLTFAKGAAFENPSRLFNASLDGNVRRSIDVGEGDRVDEKVLVRAAAALNASRAGARSRKDTEEPLRMFHSHLRVRVCQKPRRIAAAPHAGNGKSRLSAALSCLASGPADRRSGLGGWLADNRAAGPSRQRREIRGPVGPRLGRGAAALWTG
jgi:hypothetical protein